MLAALVGLVGTIGCAEPAQAPLPLPAQVRVTEVVVRDVPLIREWVGQTRGQADIDIRARVQGFLQGVHFEEGRSVTEGQLLYTIDPSELLEQVTAAEAEVAAAKTVLANAEIDVRRFRPLAEIKAISRRDLDNAVAQEEAAKSGVEAAEARLQLARINLSYTEIRSPMDGLIGLTQAQVGDFVGAAPNPIVLNTVSRIDPIHVRFSISEREYLMLARRYAALGDPQAQKERREKREPGLELLLADGTLHAHRGRAETVDRKIDAMTGTLAIEAAFPNPDRLLRPGQYAKVRSVTEVREGALLVPQRAVQELQGRFLVWVVGDDDTVKSRIVQPGPRAGDLWVIDEGLETGLRVVVEGIQRLRNGAKVVAHPYEPPAAAEGSQRQG